MKKNNQHIDDNLLLNYLRNLAGDEQKDQVEEWLKENPANRIHLEKIHSAWIHSAAFRSFEKIDTPGDWQKVTERIGFEGPVITMKPVRKNQFGSLLRIAAIAVILIGIGYLAYTITVNQGLPARQLAISTGEETSTVNLPDGSTVYLNNYSEFSYPKKFRKNSRQVILKGEAFFEVEPDAHKPFSVISGDATIKVLGTSFNVFSEPGADRVTVSVTEGKVSMFPNQQEEQSIFLTKGEQGIYRNNSLIKYDTIDPNTFSWRTGVLKFDQSALPEVIKTLEKHYNVIIHYQKNFRKDPRLTSVFEDQPLEEVLDELNLLLGLEYQQKNDTIFVQIE